MDTPPPPPSLAPLPDPFGPGQSAEDHGLLDLGANRPVSPSLVIPVAVDPPAVDPPAAALPEAMPATLPAPAVVAAAGVTQE